MYAYILTCYPKYLINPYSFYSVMPESRKFSEFELLETETALLENKSFTYICIFYFDTYIILLQKNSRIFKFKYKRKVNDVIHKQKMESWKTKQKQPEFR